MQICSATANLHNFLRRAQIRCFRVLRLSHLFQWVAELVMPTMLRSPIPSVIERSGSE